MMLRMAFAAGLVFCVATPSFAETYRCNEPYAPMMIDPNAATREQIDNLQLDVIAFLATSDMYQECLLYTLREGDAPPSEKLQKEILDKIDSNQREKERLGTEYNALVDAFNARNRAASTTP